MKDKQTVFNALLVLTRSSQKQNVTLAQLDINAVNPGFHQFNAKKEPIQPLTTLSHALHVKMDISASQVLRYLTQHPLYAPLASIAITMSMVSLLSNNAKLGSITL